VFCSRLVNWRPDKPPETRDLLEFRILQLVRLWRSLGVLVNAVTMQGEIPFISIVLLVTVTTWFLSAGAALAMELHTKDSLIKSPADALWWSAATMTTVGYGDVAPITTAGRCIAGVVMLVGISVFGAMSGIVSNMIRKQDGAETPATDLDMRHVLMEIRSLREEIHDVNTLATDNFGTLEQMDEP